MCIYMQKVQLAMLSIQEYVRFLFAYQQLLTALVDSFTLLQATIAALTQHPSILYEAFLGDKPFS